MRQKLRRHEPQRSQQTEREEFPLGPGKPRPCVIVAKAVLGKKLPHWRRVRRPLLPEVADALSKTGNLQIVPLAAAVSLLGLRAVGRVDSGLAQSAFKCGEEPRTPACSDVGGRLVQALARVFGRKNGIGKERFQPVRGKSRFATSARSGGDQNDAPLTRGNRSGLASCIAGKPVLNFPHCGVIRKHPCGTTKICVLRISRHLPFSLSAGHRMLKRNRCGSSSKQRAARNCLTHGVPSRLPCHAQGLIPTQI